MDKMYIYNNECLIVYLKEELPLAESPLTSEICLQDHSHWNTDICSLRH